MPNNNKMMMLICDGIGDRPVAELNGQTPLEAANTPNMDELAKCGETGLVDPIAPGIRAGSDTAHLALLGYDPYKYYTGRGPFEALGVGMEVLPGDLAFRLNFATVEETGGELIVKDRRAGRITEAEGTAELAATLNNIEIDGAKIFVIESTAHRAALVIRGEGLGDGATDIDPHHIDTPILTSEGENDNDARSADILNKFVAQSYETLNNHPINQKRFANGKLPANILLPRGIGLAPNIPDFGARFGIRGTAAVEVGLIRGIARYLGLEVLELPSAVNGGLDSDYETLINIALDSLDSNDFVLINAKGPDVAGHDGDVQAKIKVIERIDAELKPLLGLTQNNLYLALLADHSTPCSIGDHSGDPVPCVIAGPDVRTDSVSAFGESNVSKGGLNRILGRDVINILSQYAGFAGKFGA